MDDQICINCLKLLCYVGTTPKEQKAPQEITINARLFISLKEAGIKDQLSNTVDYSDLIRFLEVFIQNHRFNLIETVAEKCAQAILEKFSFHALEIEVFKSPFANPQSVSVRIFREKN